ncbi:phosphorylase b kinase gamma catalytic chain, liver/testis isoform isoform X4 [Vespa velutina]|uniref:phosphorylase b kinase gamma catalytic chain, liver/testis isoform isoform X4 n=1 Tax=Vespa crabro TaxID=7445 RepID=UPI001F01122C|nr:phosphorylase b kinase gamma catalytic chain, liver/testis isoform isoform X4 [Vespa crabro]XP_047369336.1 phosphorylase b kinase gamma catalytic chain, liver/testis isoform isoform X4 [Vespa velutina]
MAKDEGDDLLPDKDAAKGFYAKYEPKEILGRGISSTVRRCIEKETGIEYAAKIIDISNEPHESTEGHTMKDATLQEVHILRRVAGHPYINLCGTPGYLAPEVLKCNMFENAEGYGFEVDIWACGVIMFTLLVGCPPFWHRKQMVMLRNIMEGKYSFTSPEWADITEAPKDLIRKLLVVDPKKRISIKEALEHSFFHTVLWDQDIAPLKRSLSSNSRRLSRISQLALELKAKSFNARRRFQLAILCVRAVIRIKRLHITPEPLSTQVACTDPYRIKILRKIIDGCAFRVYGHWVKKGEGQNRAALFENAPKTELKHLYVSNLSR